MKRNDGATSANAPLPLEKWAIALLPVVLQINLLMKIPFKVERENTTMLIREGFKKTF